MSRSRSCWRIARTSAAHSISSSRVVAKMRALGMAPRQWPARPARCNIDGYRAWRADLANQIYASNVDAELQRGGGDQHPHPAFLQLLFRLQPELARHAAMVRGDRLFAHALGQMMRNPLGQPSRIDEDQRRAILAGQRDDSIINLVPHLIAGDRTEFAGGSFHRQVELAPVAGIDNHRLRSRPASGEKSATSSIGFCVAESPIRTGPPSIRVI